MFDNLLAMPVRSVNIELNEGKVVWHKKIPYHLSPVRCFSIQVGGEICGLVH